MQHFGVAAALKEAPGLSLSRVLAGSVSADVELLSQLIPAAA